MSKFKSGYALFSCFILSLLRILQAANTLGLLAFVAADLNSFKPSYTSPPSDGDASGSGFESTSLSFPKSLLLIQPLLSSYELNPVAASAQASVPVPEGLDLDEWFVPPPPEPVPERVESSEKKSKKSKKGKEKQVNGGKKSDKKKKAKDVGLEVAGDVLTPVYDEAEPPEDQAEIERVRSSPNSRRPCSDCSYPTA
jgi:AP-3 complex subunit delta-1